ncbi:DsbA family protein [Rhodospirillum centenum]|uniref:Dsba oxidoreductase, putative n=1 Tax=Rhodospirillum centenum (strain ATCC 51521 / SW) TaxID=414684 RepID=B6ISC3_RHOCS|nr:DsbA family protein [Rhodospirillum centenum]ACI98359.1 dsba oxidoreductase, putative [Rhodospirillum centenum SW]
MVRPSSVAAALLAAFLAGTAALPASAAEPLDRKAVEQIVREYLLANPEIILEAVQALEKKQQDESAAATVEAIRSNREQLTASKASPVLGNPKGDLVLVEFFDYQCGYCKHSQPERNAALKEDGKVKLVLKEFPILGPGSVVATKAALAARAQDRYAPLHEALMQHQGRLDEETVMQIAEKAGLDMAKLRKDMESESVQAEIDANLALARQLGIQGTPAFVIGDTLVPGAIEKDTFLELFKNARAAAKEKQG